jgi:hypothetical protein
MPWHGDKRRAVAGAVLLGSILAGCSDLYYDRRETVSFAAHDATATAQAVQVIDPWPAAAYNRNIAYNGAHAAGAVERYRTCQVIQPQGSITSNAYGIAAGPPTAQLGCTPQPPSATPPVR